MRKILIAGLLAFLGLSCPAFAVQDVTLCAPGTTASSADSCAHLIQPQATASALESSHVLKSTGPATLVGFQVNNTTASAIWVMVFDAATAPSAGTVTGCSAASSSRPCVIKWYQVAANSTLSEKWIPGPFPQLQTGIIVACSSTGPFTLTYSANCTISGLAM